MANLRIQRRYLSLIEVSIAFGLMMMLVSTLFFSFRTLSAFSSKLDRIKPKIVQRHLFYERLSHIFSDIDHTTLSFETDSKKSLSFLFQNPIDPKMSYFGLVKAKLYLESANQLVLEIEPHNEEESKRKEVLLQGVKSIEWDHRSPTMITLTVTPVDDSPPYTFAFFLPKTKDDFYQLELA